MNDERQVSETREQAAASLLDVVQALVHELHPGERLRPVMLDQSLDRDLGLDSLARVELLARLEQAFNATIPEQALLNAETPRDLLGAMLAASHAPSIVAVPATPAPQPAEMQPGEVRTLIEMLQWHVSAHPDRLHIRFYADDDEGEMLTYGALYAGATAVAAGLQARGAAGGQPVAIMLPTGHDYFFAFYGVLLAGGVPVSLYPPARMSQIEEHLRRQGGILRNCLAAILITLPDARPAARLLRAQVETLHEVVTIEELMSGSGSLSMRIADPHDIAFLQYTSGSTGNPKGVMLTHANILANIRAMDAVVHTRPEDVFVSWLPLYHDMGLIGAWLGSLWAAMPFVVMSPLAFITRPERWLRAMHRYGGTLSAGPNFAYALCLRRISDAQLDGLDLGRWRIAFNGAEPVSPDTIEQFCARFARYGFRRETMYPVYGLAECSVGLAFPPLHRGPVVDQVRRESLMRDRRAVPAGEGDRDVVRLVACGAPIPGHQIRIVDALDRELSDREEGRLQFRGPSATAGYFRNPEETRRLFHGEWLESGDLAYIAGGDVYITGRTKDIIIRGGRNIYPQEIEEAVGEIAGIRKGCVAVFASKNEDSGTERLIVLAETRVTDEAARERLRAEVRMMTTDILGEPPDEIVLAPPHTVLKTSSGKIRRAASRELFERGEIGQGEKAVWRQLLRLMLSAVVPELRRAARVALDTAYGIYVWAWFCLLTPLVWFAVVALPSQNQRWKMMRAAGRLLARVASVPLSVQGLERLPERPCVYVANHASYLDAYVLIAALPRRFSFVAKVELRQNPLIRRFLSRIGTEFVERFEPEKGIEDVRRLGIAARDSGRSLLFFPEGTFTRAPGLLPFHLGAFVVAAEAGVPVVPVALRGTRSILRDGSWWPRRGAISVSIGEPIGGRAPVTDDRWKAALALRDAARAYLLRHVGEPDVAPARYPLNSSDSGRHAWL